MQASVLALNIQQWMTDGRACQAKTTSDGNDAGRPVPLKCG
jgi:hypothetical protein